MGKRVPADKPAEHKCIAAALLTPAAKPSMTSDPVLQLQVHDAIEIVGLDSKVRFQH